MRRDAESVAEGDNGASLLISGENGSGKTSWLNHIEWGEIPLTKITVANRILGVPALLKLLARELALEVGDEPGAHELRKALLDGPKRAVFVDRTQNLFLSKVGGYDTFQSFVSLIEATCNQVFWITTMNGFACDHLFGVRSDLMVFRQHQKLAAWDEEQIGELIRVRCSAAGIEPIYDDLVAEAMDRTGRQARTLATEEAYDRLLWDYSNGNPRVAVHYWLRSLVPRSGNRFRVRLFRAPAPEELDELGERARFLLAALVVHQNLTILEAAEVTRYPLATCRIQMDRMWDQEILVRQRGRYRVSTHWQPAVIRALRRNNLLSV